MRTKNLLIVLCCAVVASLLLLLFSPAGQHNESFNTLMSQTHQQLQEFHENIIAAPARHRLDIDPKYLDLLGFGPHPLYNGTRYNFTIVTYVWDAAHAAAAILLAQNVAAQLPAADTLLIYDLGLAADDARQLSGYCNTTRCVLVPYDLSAFPGHVSDEHMHAYRPLLIKDALCRSRAILFLENTQRLRADARDVYGRLMAGAHDSGVLGWATRLQAVSSLTHPKMFKYFDADVESFQFLQMVSLDTVVFVDTPTVREKILLPWCKCALTMECIHPIGAQSGGCRYNKKPMYRYSGCHGYDASAFNIVLGLQWQFNASKYSSRDNAELFYTETPEEATRQLENRRRNISDAATASSASGSEHTPTMYGDMAAAAH